MIQKVLLFCKYLFFLIKAKKRFHDVIKMEGNKFKNVVVYNSTVPDFESIEKWLDSLNLQNGII